MPRILASFSFKIVIDIAPVKWYYIMEMTFTGQAGIRVCGKDYEMNNKKKTEETVRVQDDLYQHVNGEWLKDAQIPSDLPITGGFVSLALDVEKTLMNDFKRFSEDAGALDEAASEIPALKSAVMLYKKALDVDSRERAGMYPILPLLRKILAIGDIDELNRLSAKMLRDSVRLPFTLDLNEDVYDTSKQCLCIFDPEIILPDKTLYEKKLPRFVLLFHYKKMISELLKLTPLSRKEQQEFLADTLAFDEIIRVKVLSNTEKADYVKMINPMKLDEVAKLMQPFDLKGLLKDLYGNKVPDTINITNPAFIKDFKEIFNEETFTKYLHWAYVGALMAYAPALSKKISDLSRYYMNKLTGIKENPVIEKQAFRLASSMFDQPLGVYYGRKYFGEAAKEDITSIVERIIEAYKVRVRNNTFLGDQTKDKAILKLSTMKIKMGYPDSYDSFYDTLTVTEDDTYFTAVRRLSKESVKHHLDKFLKPTDFSKWSMPGHMVNACYDPFKNDITFPAAILQKPFYSVDQKLEENLGGIGAVIGHEISHAFDNNGSHFDEHGNLKDWWLEKDLENFKEQTKAMTEQFDGIPYHGGKVNGELVVSENIADNGGMAVTLQIMHELTDPDYSAYFTNWARIWCQKAKESYIKLLLTSDVHSPSELRANITPRNFPEWYDTFGVTENDKMYIEKSKRLNIW